MVENSKQVRVDNWGIYFLQRLQLFFSKTDYCDLTLQFEGNVQLKVHRLVMNACTEYFGYLEHTCPSMEDNTIIMPADLQADVIVPIVNFMYTGMLEYHPVLFDKLIKAAETMNIAVLTKLLEAQLTNNKGANSVKAEVRPKKEPADPYGPTSKRGPKPIPVVSSWKRRNPISHPASATFSRAWSTNPPEKDPLMIFDNTPKPTRFEWPDEELPTMSNMDPSFDDISLTSKPLWTKEDDHKAVSFEEAKSLAQESRHSSKANSVSQDFDEEFARKDQNATPSQLEESCENSVGDVTLKRKSDSKAMSSPKRVKVIPTEDETIISIKTSNPNELDHTKIVSEILKKYPSLVKKKKNIKLKITTCKNEQTPQIKVQTVREKAKAEPKTQIQAEKPVEKAVPPPPTPPSKKEAKQEVTITKEPKYVKKPRQKSDFRVQGDEGPWTCMECVGDSEAQEFVLYYLFRKHMTDVHHVEFESSLCKYCGKKCPTERSMAYHLFCKHILKPPSNISFPMCNKCPFIGFNQQLLEEHQRNHEDYEVQCGHCKLGFLSQRHLVAHRQVTGHQDAPTRNMMECAYCKKKHQSPVSLFNHVRSQHVKEALRDGITSLEEVMDIPKEPEASEAEMVLEKDSEMVNDAPQVESKSVQVVQQQQKDKVKIISNVKVATESPEVKHEVVATSVVSDSVTVATTTSAALSNIGQSLATNLGLVDIVVLDDSQQYILQRPQGQDGNAAEFILPDLSGNEGILQAAAAGGDINSTDELVMVLTDHDYQDEQDQGQSDNSNIVVLYSHPVEGQQGQFITSQGDLLVNSEGMLEIRNGAGITTTAGQIIVSNNTTTTTQANESPIESIELIRREIEGSMGEEVVDKDIKTVLSKKDLEKDLKLVVPPTDDETVYTDNNVESDGKENDIGLLDAADSSMQEEPMEVEEIGRQSAVNKEEECESQEETQCLETQQDDAGSAQEEIMEEEQAEVNSPSDVVNKSDLNEEDTSEAAEETMPRSVSADFPTEVLEEGESSQAANQKEEPMEIEGAEVMTQGLDEVDDGGESLLNNADNSTGSAVIEENKTEVPQDEQLANKVEDNEAGSLEGDHKEPEEELPSEENNQEATSEPQEDNEHHQQENVETRTENGQEESTVVTNFVDDFTDESQQSSSQKVNKDLNKEILDDWDDTDSQQSQKSQSQDDSQEESVPDPSLLSASEKVNKLMDDWEEEDDEDQIKE